MSSYLPPEIVSIFCPENFIFDDTSLTLSAADSRYLQLTGGTLAGNLNLVNLTSSGIIKIPDGTAGAPSLAFSASTSTGIYSPSANQLNIVAGAAGIASFSATQATIRKPMTITNQGSGITQLQLLRPDGLGSCLIMRNQSFATTVNIQGGSVNDAYIVNGSSGGNIFLEGANTIGILPPTVAVGSRTYFYGGNGTTYQSRFYIDAGTTQCQLTAVSNSLLLPSYSFTGQTDMGMCKNGTSLALCTAAAPKLEISSTDIDLRCRFRQNVKITSDAAYVLTADNANVIIYDSASPAVWSCPLSSNYLGGTLTISANGINGITINRSGSDTFKVAGISGLTTFGIPNGNTAELYSQGSYNIWRVNFVGN
jgi:hypothetical protein